MPGAKGGEEIEHAASVRRDVEPGAGEPAVLERTAVVRTAVTFRALDDALLDSYLATEEWRGRSGGYAIQGAGAQLAVSVEGEEDNVVGLPLKAVRELYRELLEGA